jgi:uncharacterized protein (TIGR03083 family)
MALPSPWPTIHAERKALAADLQSLTDDRWATPSLCTGWTVREVLGHMTATAATTPPTFFARLIGSGFRFNAMAARAIARECEGSPADTLRRFGDQVDASSHPPGPVDSWLGETIVHSEDIRRPLGISHQYPVDALTRLADFYRKSNLLIGGKKRVAGLTLRATDADWTAGTGPEVTGPALAIVLAIAGRAAAVDDLTGGGVATLRPRM